MKTLTANGANSSGATNFADVVFDAFVGFVYATMISLVIETAYNASQFKSLCSVAFTLVLLYFFSQDWMVRVIGRLRMSKSVTSSIVMFALKALVEISIVYFLLVASLAFVGIYTSGVLWNWTTEQRNVLGYAMAAFAVSCGVWNALLIHISRDVNWEQIKHLLMGHLDDKIVDQFPQIKDWRLKFNRIDAAISKIEARASTSNATDVTGASDSSSDGALEERVRKWFGYLRYWELASLMVMNPLHIILPYLLVVHVAFLNWVLGLYIVVSMWKFEGKSIVSGLVTLEMPRWALPVVCIAMCVILLLISWASLGIHYTARSNRNPRSERIGLVCLMLCILVLYSVSSVKMLVLAVALQQVAANTLMTKFFKTNSTVSTVQESTPLNASLQYEQQTTVVESTLDEPKSVTANVDRP